MRTVGLLCEGRDNNFNLLRFIAASLVLVSHCWPLTTRSNEAEPLYRQIGVTMGSAAVGVFFAISGFLIAASWTRKQHSIAFASARFFRIFPGLAVMLVLCAFVWGPAVSALSASSYFSQLATWTYVPSNLMLVHGQPGLPGVLGNVPMRELVNGSLWTLTYEVACYAVLLALGVAGMLRRERFVLTFVALMGVGVVLSLIAGDSTKGFAAKAVMLGTPFLAGMCAWIWRDKVPLHGPLIGLALAAGFFGMRAHLPGSAFLMWVALSWATLYLALVPAGPVRAFNKIGDWSFGIYVYAFPVQQTVVSLFPGIGVAALFAIAMPVTLALACLSWQLIESRALDYYRSSKGAVPLPVNG